MMFVPIKSKGFVPWFQDVFLSYRALWPVPWLGGEDGLFYINPPSLSCGGRRRRNRTGIGSATSFYAVYGRSVISASMLEMSLLGLGTVLRIERDACFNYQKTKASNK